jgi:thiamine-monophosphate kinase
MPAHAKTWPADSAQHKINETLRSATLASDEFDIIRRFFNSGELAFSISELGLGIGDDCALLSPTAGMQLAISMDILQEGVHFLPDADPYLLGQRTLLVNLSDLAAMGARPLCFTLGLCLPDADEAWLEGFSKGLAKVARENECPLVGGDLSAANPAHASKTLCVQVHGELPVGAALRRSGAKEGDLVFVTGTLGDAAAGLKVLRDACKESLSKLHRAALVEAFFVPESRIEAGQILRNLASACIDLSDGLASDLGHILRASGVGARIELDALPLSDALRAAHSEAEQIRLAISGGDDYELCFTLPAEKAEAMREALGDIGVPVKGIGAITAGTDIQWRELGEPVALEISGYKHFHAALADIVEVAH